MNKFLNLISIISIVMLSSCKLNKPLDPNYILTINDFSMNQVSDNGEKLYTIISPKSFLNKMTSIYELEGVEIIFYGDDKPKYIINADFAMLNSTLLTLDGDVIIKNVDDTNSTLNSNSLYWDTANSLITLEGNVIFEDNYINLLSSKAILNQDSDIVEFFNPVKYFYKEVNNDAEYKISSENAYYDLENNRILFSSENGRVQSTLSF